MRSFLLSVGFRSPSRLLSVRNSRLSPSSFPSTQTQRTLSYVQGQYNDKRREYFYFIDHQGQLFLDDTKIKNFTSCFKEKEFLLFFFQRLRLNETGFYEDEFPYLSPCGRERNYVRCDDVPIVFTHFVDADADAAGKDHPRRDPRLSWGGVGDRLTTLFEPKRICMLPSTGRVYHPAEAFVDLPIGLVKSNLAIELSQYFEFDRGEEEPPTHFNWMGERYILTNELILIADQFSKPDVS